MTQGLARKLMPTVPTAGRDTLRLPGEGWVDLATTKELWDNVFEAPESLIRKNDWIDRPSVGIPYLYVATGIVLSEGLERTGRTAAADSVIGRTEQVARATRLSDLFGGAQPAEPRNPDLGCRGPRTPLIRP